MNGNKQNASNSDTDINELVAKHVNNLDDKGKLQLPNDMPDWQKHVVRAEKRQRDAQAELGRTQADLRKSTAANGVLMDAAGTIIPDDFQLNDAELEDLKHLRTSDPDAYRLRVNDLEGKAKDAQSTKLKEATAKAGDDADLAHVAKNRLSVLQDFREANPELVITDDVLINDVPPRLLAGVTEGNYSYGEYLDKVKVYISTGKKAPGSENNDPHNINSMPGSNTPGKGAAERAGKSDYAKITF